MLLILLQLLLLFKTIKSFQRNKKYVLIIPITTLYLHSSTHFRRSFFIDPTSPNLLLFRQPELLERFQKAAAPFLHFQGVTFYTHTHKKRKCRSRVLTPPDKGVLLLPVQHATSYTRGISFTSGEQWILNVMKHGMHPPRPRDTSNIPFA